MGIVFQVKTVKQAEPIQAAVVAAVLIRQNRKVAVPAVLVS
jgi:hypothetical protein